MTPLDLLQSKTTHSSTQTKLSALRVLMRVHQLDAYLIPSADEHLNEYVPEAKQRRTWISGFKGSAGDFLVAHDESWLFVDSRYYEQAELEVEQTQVRVAKVGLEGEKTLVEVLETWGQAATTAEKSFRLGFDPFTVAVAQFRALEKQLEQTGVELVPVAENLVDRVRLQAPWIESEPLPAYADSAIFCLPDELAGATVEQKLARLREAMQKAKTTVLPLTKLDQIAWLFNLRGWDVAYNPVLIAYAIVTLEQAFLFTNLERIDAGVQETLQRYGSLLPYSLYGGTLKTLLQQSDQERVLLDPKHTTMGTYAVLKDPDPGLSEPRVQIVETDNPIEGMKARKNAIEIEQMQAANLKASRAKTRTLKWLSDQIAAGKVVSELDLAQTIEQFYQAETGFQGLSFNTIAATGPNSSIVHYGTPSAKALLQPGQLVLLDSGSQYLGGTTDDTRTVIVGEPTPDQIERYTEVLKAHINCAMQRFPKGTTGSQLDGIARSTLWHAGLDYGHGTGHGVGAFLNVHEGPNGISKRVQEPLEPGMVTSVEPGFYQPGWGGIRLENLYVVQELSLENSPANPAETKWYGFTSLTYIPFDQRLIDFSRLDTRQREWLKNYYADIVEKLSPTLDAGEVEWLKQVCDF